MKKIYFLTVIPLCLQLLLLTNIQFTAWPEMTSYAYLYNNHFILYKDFIFPYTPLLVWFLAFLYKIFGYKLLILKIFSWSLSLTNSLLIFLITKKITKKNNSALLACFIYTILQPLLEGNMLWFDNIIVTPLLLSFYFLIPPKKLMISGLFISLAILIKQTSGLYLLIIFVFLLVKYKNKKNALVFVTPSIIFGLILLFYVLSKNIFLDFINWTLLYPFTKWSHFPGYVQLSLTSRQSLTVILLFFPLIFSAKKLIKNYSQILLFLIPSLLAVYPRFSFFHFQPALAFLCILYGLLFTKYLIIMFILPFLVNFNWHQQSRFWRDDDIVLAKIISQTVSENETVFLLGPHSGIYTLSNRVPPKPWSDNFGWYFEIPNIQDEIIKKWKQNPPKYIFWASPKNGNWFDLGAYQPKTITNWIENNYTKGKEIQPGIFQWQKRN